MTMVTVQQPEEIAADVRRAVAAEAMIDDLPGGHRQHQRGARGDQQRQQCQQYPPQVRPDEGRERRQRPQARCGGRYFAGVHCVILGRSALQSPGDIS